MALPHVRIEDMKADPRWGGLSLEKKLKAVNIWGGSAATQAREKALGSEQYASLQDRLQGKYDEERAEVINSTLIEGGKGLNDEQYAVFSKSVDETTIKSPNLTAQGKGTAQIIKDGRVQPIGKDGMSNVDMLLRQQTRMDGKTEVDVTAPGVSGMDKTIFLGATREGSIVGSQESIDDLTLEEDEMKAKLNKAYKEKIDPRALVGLQESISVISSKIFKEKGRLSDLEAPYGTAFMRHEELTKALKEDYDQTIRGDFFSRQTAGAVGKAVIDAAAKPVEGAARLVRADGVADNIKHGADTLKELTGFTEGRTGSEFIGDFWKDTVVNAAINEAPSMAVEMAIAGGSTFAARKIAGASVKGVSGFVGRNAGKIGAGLGGASGGARAAIGEWDAQSDFIKAQHDGYESVDAMEEKAKSSGDEELLTRVEAARKAESTQVMNFYANFIQTGSLEMLPLQSIMKRGKVAPLNAMADAAKRANPNFVKKTFTEKIGQWTKERLADSTKEGVTEGLQGVVSASTARAFYDENRDMFEGVGEDAAVGFIIGGMASSVTSQIGKKKVRELQAKADRRFAGLSEVAVQQKEIDKMRAREGALKNRQQLSSEVFADTQAQLESEKADLEKTNDTIDKIQERALQDPLQADRVERANNLSLEINKLKEGIAADEDAEAESIQEVASPEPPQRDESESTLEDDLKTLNETYADPSPDEGVIEDGGRFRVKAPPSEIGGDANNINFKDSTGANAFLAAIRGKETMKPSDVAEAATSARATALADSKNRKESKAADNKSLRAENKKLIEREDTAFSDQKAAFNEFNKGVKAQNDAIKKDRLSKIASAESGRKKLDKLQTEYAAVLSDLVENKPIERTKAPVKPVKGVSGKEGSWKVKGYDTPFTNVENANQFKAMLDKSQGERKGDTAPIGLPAPVLNPATGRVNDPKDSYKSKPSSEQVINENIPEVLKPPPAKRPTLTSSAITREEDGTPVGTSETDGRTLLEVIGPRGENSINARPRKLRKGISGLIERGVAGITSHPLKPTKWMMPSDMFAAKTKKDNANAAIKEKMRFMAVNYTEDLELQLDLMEVSGSIRSEQKDSIERSINDYFITKNKIKKDSALLRIPPAMRPLAVQMQQDIKDITLLAIRSGAVDGDLAVIFQSKVGSYLHRSYQIHTNPNWAKEQRKDNPNWPAIVAEAKLYFKNYLKADTEKAQNRLVNYFIDPESTSGMGLEVKFRESNTGGLTQEQRGILEKKKEVPKEIRALMGEVTDPLVNYINSVTKPAMMIYSYNEIVEIKEAGIKSGDIFPPDATDLPEDAYVAIASENSKALEPLQGYITTPFLRDILKLAYSNDAVQKRNGQLNALIGVNALVKKSLTVYNPASHVRNAISAALMYAGNGHFNPKDVTEAFAEVFGTIRVPRGEGRQEKQDLIVEYHSLGIVDQDLFGAELSAVMGRMPKGAFSNAAHMTRDFEKLSSVMKALKLTDEKITSVYRGIDSAFKVASYKGELRVLSRAQAKGSDPKGMAPITPALKLGAATRVRATMPTYDMAPEAIKALSRNVMLGTFVTFTAESVRVRANQLKLIALDSKTPGMRGAAARRAAGMLGTSTIFHAGALATAVVYGIKPDDEKDYREALPPWYVNDNLLWSARPTDGIVKYIPTGSIDPYSYEGNLKSAIFQAIKGGIVEDPSQTMSNIFRASFEPFYGEEVGFKTIVQLFTGRDEWGNEIVNETDTKAVKAKKLAKHGLKSVSPTWVKKILKGAENPEFDGVKESARSFNPFAEKTLDMRDSLSRASRNVSFKSRDINDAIIKSILQGADIDQTLSVARDGIASLATKATSIMDGAIKAGVTAKEAKEIVFTSASNNAIARSISGREAPEMRLSVSQGKELRRKNVELLEQLYSKGVFVYSGDKRVSLRSEKLR